MTRFDSIRRYAVAVTVGLVVGALFGLATAHRFGARPTEASPASVVIVPASDPTTTVAPTTLSAPVAMTASPVPTGPTASPIAPPPTVTARAATAPPAPTTTASPSLPPGWSCRTTSNGTKVCGQGASSPTTTAAPQVACPGETGQCQPAQPTSTTVKP